MIKRALVFFGLAILCVITVFGTGFALWAFDAESSATRRMGVRVTQSTVLGTFVVPEIKQVVLDGGTGSGVNPTITGVSFYKENDGGVAVTDNTFTIRFQVKDEFKDMISKEWTDNKDNPKDCPSVHFGIRVDVPEELKGLITHTDFYNSHIASNVDKNGYIDLKALTIELTDHFSDPNKSDFNYEPTDNEFTFALTTTTLNRFFTYLPSKEPTALDKYGNLDGNFAACFTIELWQGYGQTA